MKSTTDSEAFIADDMLFSVQAQNVALLDPLSVRENGDLAVFQAHTDELAVAAAKDLTNRLITWQEQRLGKADGAEIGAVRRDYDKVVGSFVARKQPLIDVVPEIATAFNNFLEAGLASPRADFYDFAYGSDDVLDHTYTGDVREISLVQNLTASTMAAHGGLHAILRARQAMKQGEAAADHLQDAQVNAERIRQLMASVYREAGPAFVAQQVLQCMGGVRHQGSTYEGPNPSHSGFLLLDRFLYGPYDDLYAKNQDLAAHYTYRQHNMPGHMRRFLSETNTPDNALGLVEMARQYQPEAVGAAGLIASLFRKVKVMHKSYADKGLAARGKTLNPAEPDLLSDNIAFARSREV